MICAQHLHTTFTDFKIATAKSKRRGGCKGGIKISFPRCNISGRLSLVLMSLMSLDINGEPTSAVPRPHPVLKTKRTTADFSVFKRN